MESEKSFDEMGEMKIKKKNEYYLRLFWWSYMGNYSDMFHGNTISDSFDSQLSDYPNMSGDRILY